MSWIKCIIQRIGHNQSEKTTGSSGPAKDYKTIPGDFFRLTASLVTGKDVPNFTVLIK